MMRFRFFNNTLFNIFFCVALGLSMYSCENDSNEISAVTKKDNAPLEKIENLQTIYSDSGIVKVKVTAPVLNKYVQPNTITELPKGINIDFYNEDFKVVSKLKAKYAIHFEKQKQWIAKNDVVVVNEKNEQLNTEKLIWDEKTGTIRSDQFVKITTPEEIIMGQGFEADQNFNQYRIFKVTGTITVKK
jgi:LPS export ABC transporter protein LptC